MALNAIALFFSSNVSAHGGGLNAEGCPNDRKCVGCHCHRGGGVSPRSDAVSTNRVVPSRIAALRVSRDPSVFVNCAAARAARAAGAAAVRHGEPGYGPQLDSDGDGWDVSRSGDDAGLMLM